MVYLINGLTFAMMLFILSSGLNIILGFLGVINFAHGALFILGAYVTYTVTKLFDNYWLALLVAPLATGAFGFVTELFFCAICTKGTTSIPYC
jgi:branched-chain amino acid transport system permease protein